jgi:threonine dehydratase
MYALVMVSLDDIRQAQHTLQGIIVRTPLISYTQAADDRRLWFKPENLQPIGAFKLRGAYNKIASLTAEERRRGVITYSSGNHAQGVAYAARALGTRAVIVMPGAAPRVKLEATAALGAEIVKVGGSSGERQQRAEELAREHGYIIVPPYNDEHIIAGQGTAGLEIVEDLPDVDLVLVPVGGGGLSSGVAAAIKETNSRVKVIGVEPEVANDAQQSLKAGRVIQIGGEQTARTLADGLRTQSVGEINFAHLSRYLDGIITVSEDEIKKAMREIALKARLVAEPSGAVTFAAYCYHSGELPASRNTVAIISGGNVEPELLAQVLQGEPAQAQSSATHP